MSSQLPNESWEDPGEDDAEDLAPAIQQPATSKLTIERFPDGLTIQVPPTGHWKGLLIFAILWNAVLAFIVCGLLGTLMNNGGKNNDAVSPLILLAGGLVGAGLVAAAVHLKRRHTVIAVTAGRLMTMQTGLFGTKQREWPAEEILAIQIGRSGVEVNNKPLNQLQITEGSGRKTGLLTGQSDDELYWIASELRQALSMPA